MIGAGILGAVAGGTKFAGAVGYIELVIPSGKVASNLTGFPVFVDLSHMTSAFWENVKSDGGNIRVYESDGVTMVPHDVVTIDKGTSTGRLYFKSSLLAASDNTFRIAYEGDLSKLAVDDANGRNAVWSDYERFYDFSENVDRTGEGGAINLVNQAAVTGGVLELDGADDYAYSNCDSSTTWTMGCIVTNDAISGQNRAFVTFGDTAGASGSRATVGYYSAATALGIWNNTNGWKWVANPLTTGVAAHIHAYHNGTSGRGVYHSGAIKISEGTCAARPSGTTRFYVGAEDNAPGEEVDGRYRLAYLRLSVLSADWIAAEYASWSTPASFYTANDP